MNNTRGLMTQNLDKLAANGVTLRNYYVGPICSPTRSMLMTGRYTMRLGTQSNVIYWDTPWGVPINETFVGQNMQDAGLSTGMFGKWHLGMFQPRSVRAVRCRTVRTGRARLCSVCSVATPDLCGSLSGAGADRCSAVSHFPRLNSFLFATLLTPPPHTHACTRAHPKVHATSEGI